MLLKKTLRGMVGPVKMNETSGLLFEDGKYFSFGYRHAGQKICVDTLGFLDRFYLSVEGNGLVGYDLSGKPADARYGHLYCRIPDTTEITGDITEENVLEHDGEVVVYKGEMAVIKRRGIMYRETPPPSILEKLEMPAEYDPMKSLVIIEFWGGPMPITHKGKEIPSIMAAEANSVLSRNGI